MTDKITPPAWMVDEAARNNGRVRCPSGCFGGSHFRPAGRLQLCPPPAGPPETVYRKDACGSCNGIGTVLLEHYFSGGSPAAAAKA